MRPELSFVPASRVQTDRPGKRAAGRGAQAKSAEGDKEGRVQACTFRSSDLKAVVACGGTETKRSLPGDTGVLNNRYRMLRVHWSQAHVSRYLPGVTICWLPSNILPARPLLLAPCFH